MPKSSEFVFVNETDPNTGQDTTSVGLVVHVYSEDDAGADTSWWDAVKDKGLADVLVFRRNGSTQVMTVSKSETYTDDDGKTRKRAGTYETSESADTTAPVSDPSTPPSGAATPPGDPATAANTQSGDQTVAATSGAQTATQGTPGWFPGQGNG